MAPIHIVELVKARAIPEDNPEEQGILLEGTLSLPFALERTWSGNAGYYVEEYLVRSGDRQVYHSSPQQIFVRGLQSITTHVDQINDRFQLEPGSCQLEFFIDGVPMDSIEIPVKALSAV